MAETRKLAAILAADVVGYSRLTGFDEQRKLARLRALRSDLVAPTIAVHNGRVVKRTGNPFVVIKRMPERDGQFEYRVRSSYEPYERVVRESQLRAERAATLTAPSGHPLDKGDRRT